MRDENTNTLARYRNWNLFYDYCYQLCQFLRIWEMGQKTLELFRTVIVTDYIIVDLDSPSTALYVTTITDRRLLMGAIVGLEEGLDLASGSIL